MKTLRVTTQGGETLLCPLNREVGFSYHIGRAKECHIAVEEDGRLSRRHCAVTIQQDGVTIEDLGSTNGILRGRKRITKERMKPHAVYVAGNTELVLLDSDIPAPAETAPAPKTPEPKKLHPAPTAPRRQQQATEHEKSKQAPALHNEGVGHPHSVKQGGTNLLHTTMLPQTEEKRRRFDASWLLALLGVAVLVGPACFLFWRLSDDWEDYDDFDDEDLPALQDDIAADDTPMPDAMESTGMKETETEEESALRRGLRGDASEEARRLAARGEKSYDEEDVPADPKQTAVPKARPAADFTSALATAHRLEKLYEQVEKEPYIDKDLSGARFHDSYALYQEIADRVLQRLGKLDEASLLSFLESPANRLDLARLTIIRRLGSDAVNDIANDPVGPDFLAAVMRDLNWCNGILHSGTSHNLEQGLRNLLILYTKDRGNILENEVLKRTATSCAMEFGRFGWDEDAMVRRYCFYRDSFGKRLLNSTFKELQYWDMRFVTGSPPSPEEGMGWGNVRNLTWMRDNVRLPAEQYLGACGQVDYRLRNVAGDSVFSDEYLAPVSKYTNNTIAWAHREIGGVCGALSHFAAVGALANGLPACAMGEPGHCSFTLRLGKQWHLGNSVSWMHYVGKNFWNHGEWDYLILTQQVYDERYKTLLAEDLVALADFLGGRKKTTAAFTCYETALRVQPLFWPAYGRYGGYLSLKAPQDADKWHNLHDFVANGIGKTYYCAAADLMREVVYPGLAPHMKDSRLRNRKFAAFFSHITDWGTNRWDVKPLLNAQISYCTTHAERLDYIRDALFVLMSRRDYAGSVLSWGLDYTLHNIPEEEQDHVYNMLLLSMTRARTSKKEADATWAMFSEAISAAEQNKDRRAFQAIGRLARIKMRKRFSNRALRAPRFPGNLLSENALLLPKEDSVGMEDPNACQHWAVLQRFGGKDVDFPFSGMDAGPLVILANRCEITGATVVLAQPIAEEHRDEPFAMLVSDDMQNWVKAVPVAKYDNKLVVTFDARRKHIQGRYVRIVLLGRMKMGIPINGIYIYGRKLPS